MEDLKKVGGQFKSDAREQQSNNESYKEMDHNDEDYQPSSLSPSIANHSQRLQTFDARNAGPSRDHATMSPGGVSPLKHSQANRTSDGASYGIVNLDTDKNQEAAHHAEQKYRALRDRSIGAGSNGQRDLSRSPSIGASANNSRRDFSKISESGPFRAKLVVDANDAAENEGDSRSHSPDQSRRQSNTSPLRMPYYHELKEVQQQISSVYASFPMQRNQDFIDYNYEAIIKKSAAQLQFLFVKTQRARQSIDSGNGLQASGDLSQHIQQQLSRSRDRQLDNNYNQMLNDHAHADIKLLKESLQKSENIVQNLRRENEYFQKQLDVLRKDASDQLRKRANSTPGGSRERKLGYIPNQHNVSVTNSNGGLEPQIHPMPHPQPVLLQDMHANAFQNSPLKTVAQHQNHQNSMFPPISQNRNTSLQNRQHGNFSNERRPVSGVGPIYSQQDLEVLKYNIDSQQPNSKQATQATAPRAASKGKRTLSRKANDENNDPASTAPVQMSEQETKELKFDMQQLTEKLALKTRTIENLSTQLEQQKRRLTTDAQKIQTELTSENESLKRQLTHQKEHQVSKDAQLFELKQQCSELVQAKTIEMSLLINKPLLVSQKSSSSGVANRQNRNTNNIDKKSKKIQFAMDINQEMEQLLAEANGDASDLKLGNKKKSRKSKNQANLGGADQAAPTPSYIASLVTSETLLQNQIEAAILSEALIDELKNLEQSNESDVSRLSSSCDSLTKHATNLDSQKKTLETKLSELSKDNDALKQKFSSLLDQFQEYVTLQESKQVSDQEKQKQQQDTLVSSMQENIRELEQVTEGLQSELQHKENVFNMLKKENEDLESKLATKTREEGQAVTSAMQRLEEEVRFLKRHHEIEITMMKEQYERSLETAKLIAEEKLAQAAAAAAASAQNQSTFHISQMQNGTIPVNETLPGHQQLSQANPVQSHDLQQQRDTLRISQVNPAGLSGPSMQDGFKNVSDSQNLQQPMHQYSNTSTLQNISAHQINNTNGNGSTTPPSKSRVKEIISTTQNTFDKLKRDLSDKEQLIEEKNREIIQLRCQNEELAQKFNIGAGRQFQPGEQQSQVYGTLSGHERRQVVQDVCYIVDSLRAELQRVKATMFAQTGKRTNLEGNRSFAPSNVPIATEEAMQQELQIQMQEIRALMAIAGELNMLAASCNNAKDRDNSRRRSASPQLSLCNQSNVNSNVKAQANATSKVSSQNMHDSNYQIKRNADNLLRQNHASGLHELLCEQVTRSETLMQDNALMQRSLYKYETTLAELDVILRNEARDQVIYDLKKLVENQLKQIITLQKDGEMGKNGYALQNSSSSNNVSNPFEASRGINGGSDNEKIRELKTANEELLQERRGLMENNEKMELESKHSHKNLEEALDRINEMEKQVREKDEESEEIRTKITKVAELFERKEIKQKYSFEVLCDFIHDKAKRLYSKYDNVQKEKKVMQEEKNFYFQRKVDQLEQENHSMKETTRQAERIFKEIVPRINEQLDRPVQQQESLSEYIFARQVLDMIEIEYRTIKKAHSMLIERNNELQRQSEAFQSEFQKRSPAILSQPNGQMQQTQQQYPSLGATPSQNSQSNLVGASFGHHNPSLSLQPTIKQTEQQQMMGGVQTPTYPGLQQNENHYDYKLIQARQQEQEEIFKSQQMQQQYSNVQSTNQHPQSQGLLTMEMSDKGRHGTLMSNMNQGRTGQSISGQVDVNQQYHGRHQQQHSGYGQDARKLSNSPLRNRDLYSQM